MEQQTYLGLRSIGELFGVSAGTVSKWRTRYADTNHPCPDPTAWIDDTPGWTDPATWKAWYIERPGRGAGGGPLPLTSAQIQIEAARANVEKDHPNDRPGRRQLRILHQVATRLGVDMDVLVALANKIADDNMDRDTDECDIIAVATLIRSKRSGATTGLSGARTLA